MQHYLAGHGPSFMGLEPEVRLFSCRAHLSALSTILTDAFFMSQRNHPFALVYEAEPKFQPPAAVAKPRSCDNLWARS
ncbi:hypothetical protein CSAL01_12581 [Colletotrichum salicis]|uniref:Uncharacterized protein n=1 Tax=Colletotrichum salicis TaxID=1209931 RepID=A0A135UGG9_9PEZI|nr:hypothetical protein CSAL01_12581 [Colletotrichum salicis]